MSWMNRAARPWRGSAMPQGSSRAPGAPGAIVAALAFALGLSLIVGPVRADDDPAPAPDTAQQDGGGAMPHSGSGEGEGDGVGVGDPTAPLQAGGGNLPGQKPGDGTAAEPEYADGGPAIDPGFVDDYTAAWKSVERGKEKVDRLKGDLVGARQTLAASFSDFALAVRVRNLSDFHLGDSSQQLDTAVRNLYISGTTDVDVILGVMGSEPDDVLRNIDSFVYLRSATGQEAADYGLAKDASVLAQSATAASLIRAEDDRARVDRIMGNLGKTRKQLKKDKEELQQLVNVAAPQTVVGANGCPKAVLEGTVPEGINIKQLCGLAVRTASSAQAAFAIKWALVRLGAPYACEGIGRLDPWRYDCSSFVARAYAEGAGLSTAGDGWAPSTRNMVPWDGATLDPHYAVIKPTKVRPGDLVLYDTCPPGEVCPYRHVVMYLGPVEKGGVPMMVHTNRCGSVAHVEPFTGITAPNLLGVRRVVAASGERVLGSLGNLPADKPGKKDGGKKDGGKKDGKPGRKGASSGASG